MNHQRILIDRTVALKQNWGLIQSMARPATVEARKDGAARFQSRLALLDYGYVDQYGGRSSDDVQAWSLTQRWYETPMVRTLLTIALATAIVAAGALALWLLATAT